MHDTAVLLSRWFAPLPEHSSALFLVGGSVRDLLLGRSPKDIDLICSDPLNTAQRIAAVHQAKVVPFEKRSSQTCYRVVNQNDTTDFLDISGIQGADIREDLLKRDFTINALAMPVLAGGRLGEIIDPASGQDDLQPPTLRMVSQEAFDADPVRMLRAFRFAAVLEGSIEDLTLEAIRGRVETLNDSAAERLALEWLLLLGTVRSAPAVRLMESCSLLEVLFPEVSPMRGCTQNAFHHLDVLEHSFNVLEHCEAILNDLPGWFPDCRQQVQELLAQNHQWPLLKMAALLHDVGKPQSKGKKADSERITFYEHDKAGAEMIQAMSRRLKLSNKDGDFLSSLVAEHLHVLALSAPDVRKATVLRWFRKMKDQAVPCLILSMADTQGTQGRKSSGEERDSHVSWACAKVEEYFAGLKAQLEREPLLTGRDLIAMGLEPGPRIGKILRWLEHLRDEGSIMTRQEALDAAGQIIRRQNHQE